VLPFADVRTTVDVQHLLCDVTSFRQINDSVSDVLRIRNRAPILDITDIVRYSTRLRFSILCQLFGSLRDQTGRSKGRFYSIV
jgi:hypothetical protein